MVNIRKFTGVPFRSLDELVDRDMLDRAGGRASSRACVRARLSIVFAGAPGSGKTTLLSCCAAELDPSLRVVDRRGGLRGRRPAAERGVSMQTRPARADRRRGRPAPARRRVPAHGARRRHRRRGPRPRGAAAAAHPVVGRQGLHHHPRRLGPPGAHPAAVHLPARRHVVASSRCRRSTRSCQRGDRRRRPLRPHARRVRGSPRSSRVEDLAGGADATQFTVTEVFARPGADAPLALDRQPARPGRAGRFDEAGVDLARPARTAGAAGDGSCAADRRSLLAVRRRLRRPPPLHRGRAAAGAALGARTDASGARRPRRAADDWLAQAGLDDVAPGEFARASIGRARRASAPLVGYALFGGAAARARRRRSSPPSFPLAVATGGGGPTAWPGPRRRGRG